MCFVTEYETHVHQHILEMNGDKYKRGVVIYRFVMW